MKRKELDMKLPNFISTLYQQQITNQLVFVSATPQTKDVFVRQANTPTQARQGLGLIQLLNEQLAVIETKNHQSHKILDKSHQGKKKLNNSKTTTEL